MSAYIYLKLVDGPVCHELLVKSADMQLPSVIHPSHDVNGVVAQSLRGLEAFKYN
jgi:hypothetical protein